MGESYPVICILYQCIAIPVLCTQLYLIYYQTIHIQTIDEVFIPCQSKFSQLWWNCHGPTRTIGSVKGEPLKTVNILNSSTFSVFCVSKLEKSSTFQSTFKKSSSAMPKSEKCSILSPLTFSISITSTNLPQTALQSSTETALMKVKNDLLFWPGLCISPCFLSLECNLWLCWSLYPSACRHLSPFPHLVLLKINMYFSPPHIWS